MSKTKSATNKPDAPKTVVKNLRLTNEIRNAFVAAVMADVPTTDYEQTIRDAVNKALREALPAEVKSVLNNPKLSAYIRTQHFSLRQCHGLPHGRYVSFNLPGEDSEKMQDAAEKIAAPFAKAWCAQEDQRKNLSDKLKAVAYSCTTTTKLAEAFPEFARYLPQTEAEATRNLPALANVVSDFVKAGWPKGSKGAVAHAARPN